MNTKINSISNWLLAFSAIAFLALYFILSLNTRLASDDIVFVSIKKNMDLFEYLKSFYLSWSGRWASGIYFYTITSLTDNFENIHFYTFLYYCLTMGVLFYSVKKIIHFSILHFFSASIEKTTSAIFSILFIACFYYSTFQSSEVWWWLCSSVDTLQGIVFLLFGISLLMKEKKHILHYILICLSFIYVGGCFEIYALIIESFCFFMLAYFLFVSPNRFSELRNKYIYKGIIVAFTCLFISSIISFSAPGNRNRRNVESISHSIENVAPIKTNVIEDGKNIFAQKKYLLAFGLASLWIILGMNVKGETKTVKTNSSILKMILLSSIPLFLSFSVTWVFQTLFLDEFHIPMRGWTFTSFSLAFFFCFLCYCVGYSSSFKLPFFQSSFKIILPSIVLILLSFNAIKQYKYTSIYAKEYDFLIGKLLEAKKDTTIKTSFVKELPPSGMLIPLDISDDYMKDPLKVIFGLNSEITIIK